MHGHGARNDSIFVHCIFALSQNTNDLANTGLNDDASLLQCYGRLVVWYSRGMNNQRKSKEDERAAVTGYISKEAFDRACCLLVERSQNKVINGMSLRLQDEVRLL